MKPVPKHWSDETLGRSQLTRVQWRNSACQLVWEISHPRLGQVTFRLDLSISNRRIKGLLTTLDIPPHSGQMGSWKCFGVVFSNKSGLGIFPFSPSQLEMEKDFLAEPDDSWTATAFLTGPRVTRKTDTRALVAPKGSTIRSYIGSTEIF